MDDLRHALALYGHLIGISLRSQLQYRRAFALHLVAMFLITFSEFAALLVLFGRFPRIGAWRVEDVAVLYGLSSMSFALGELLGDGFNTCTALVRRGDFDRLLLRPAGTFLQMLAADFQVRRLGRFAQGMVALIFGISRAHSTVASDPGRLAIIPLAIVCGSVVYMALFVLQATLCFWSTEAIEVANMLTNGGSTLASYPMEIFPNVMRSLFTFVVPLAFVSYYPTVYLLHKPDGLGMAHINPFFAPAIALAFLLLAMRMWSFGVHHYRSTGS